MDRHFSNDTEFEEVKMIIHLQNQIHLDICFILDTEKWQYSWMPPIYMLQTQEAILKVV